MTGLTNTMMKITKFHKDAKVPLRHSKGAAGYDISALCGGVIGQNQVVKIKTGLGFDIPKNCIGIIFGRSGLALKNGIEVLDSKIFPGSTDELVVTLLNKGTSDFTYESGARIAQLVIANLSHPDFELTSALGESERGENGFGSTGLL